MCNWCNTESKSPHCNMGCRDRAEVGALPSHHYGRGSIPGPDVTCELSLLLVLLHTPRIFNSPIRPVLRFFSLYKNQCSKLQLDSLIWSSRHVKIPVTSIKTESARSSSNEWTKTWYQDYLHCIANFCRALLNIFSKQFISSNTKRRKRMLNFV